MVFFPTKETGDGQSKQENTANNSLRSQRDTEDNAEWLIIVRDMSSDLFHESVQGRNAGDEKFVCYVSISDARMKILFHQESYRNNLC